ncbi:MAG: NAD+ synthase [Candidatus Zixiibacteriota bacterium]|nr:MAG: NAD+ synthase [candidate division Zixibacteria bacterium]
MKVTIAQLNPIVGDVLGNVEKLKKVFRAEHTRSDLIVAPELFVCGYPPRDLLKRPAFLDQVDAAAEELKRFTAEYPEIGLVVGFPVRPSTDNDGRLFNAAVLMYGGEVVFRQAKSLLPTYDVFDETRYFEVAESVSVIDFKGMKLGLNVCEDAWSNRGTWVSPAYDLDPVKAQVDAGADLLINISASPFKVGKDEIRFRLIQGHAQRHGKPFVYVNQVGGNDELIFDGCSLAFDADGKLIAALPSFKEQVVTLDLSSKGTENYHPLDAVASVHDALVLGVRDYVRKCGFERVIVGLSGGIDSALTVALAATALGGKNVRAITMPSVFSAAESAELSHRLANNLGCICDEISIGDIYEAYKKTLGAKLEIGSGVDVTLENLQARIRGNILMAHSNKFGSLLLATGNKSELATGYCTLYGDMAGGLAVLSDVPKTMVYELAEYINREREIIPRRIIDRPPTAELRPNQKDQDSLPPYDVLDRVLQLYIEEETPLATMLNMDIDPQVVRWVVRTVNRNEYKRRQVAPGLKVTSKAFGVGRRMPIAARYEL